MKRAGGIPRSLLKMGFNCLVMDAVSISLPRVTLPISLTNRTAYISKSVLGGFEYPM